MYRVCQVTETAIALFLGGIFTLFFFCLAAEQTTNAAFCLEIRHRWQRSAEQTQSSPMGVDACVSKAEFASNILFSSSLFKDSFGGSTTSNVAVPICTSWTVYACTLPSTSFMCRWSMEGLSLVPHTHQQAVKHFIWGKGLAFACPCYVPSFFTSFFCNLSFLPGQI